MDPISQEIIEALLSGKAPASSLPPELAKVQGLIDRATVPPSYQETLGAHQLVNAMKAANEATVPTRGRSRVLSKLLTTKAAATAAAIALTGGAAAALTGVVPVSFNKHVPTTTEVSQATDSSTSSTDAPASTVTTQFAGESQGMASGANWFGECTAYSAITGAKFQSSTTTSSTPSTVASSTTVTGALASTNFQNLAQLATAQGYSSISSFCATVLSSKQHGAGTANANANAGVNAQGHGHGPFSSTTTTSASSPLVTGTTTVNPGASNKSSHAGKG